MPGVEVGLRHDGGDAERGSGVDIGGKLVVSSPAMGLTAELRMRTLLVHEAEGFRDRGVSVSLSFDPMPSTPPGFKARMEPSWGGRDQGGAEALWGGGPVSELAARGGHVSGGSVLTDLGYGMAPPSHPDLLAEKLQTRSILTLHLVSFQGVRSLAGSDPGVTPRRMVTWARTRKWASFTDEHAATASVRNSTQGGLLTWDLIRPGSPAIWWRFSAVSVRWSQISSNGKCGRSCSPSLT